MKIKTEVNWDTDGDSLEDCGLTKIFILEDVPDDFEDEDELEDWVSDELSNRTGFCHFGFQILEIIKD